jgi:glucarate dehydratase
MQYKNGKVAVPSGPRLGVELDRDKMQQYAELFQRTGGYCYDRDPGRPGWFAVIPESRFAQPAQSKKTK